MKRTPIFVFLYLAAIVAANTTLIYQTFGPLTIIINSLLFIGFDQTSRDYLHEDWHGNPWKLLLLIGMGGALTLLLNAGSLDSAKGVQIVIASVAAFVISEGLDSSTYSLLKGRMLKVNGSNVVSSIADSLIFPVLAGFGLSWGLFLGLTVAKIVGGFIWYMLLEQTEPVRYAAGNGTDVA